VAKALVEGFKSCLDNHLRSGDRKMAADYQSKTFNILSLDGGGAKGFYTLGILREVEVLLGKPLSDKFDLIFGTSTGSIIGSLLALGYDVEEIHQLYKTYVPEVMKQKKRSDKSKALANLADTVFENKSFEDVLTGLGVVTTNWQLEKPMIFKGSVKQSHGRAATFVPGFGVRMSDAVQASCSAVPFFNKKKITTSSGVQIELIDGGYCANNPTLYAIADAVAAMKVDHSNCRVLSLGCGVYPEPKPSWKEWAATKYLESVQLLLKTFQTNTTSMEQLRLILFKDVQTVRINDAFERPEMAAGLFEADLDKLNLLRLLGAESFAQREVDVKNLFSVGD
jgi:predicted acylesterase/phospholipase RssA